MHGARELLSIPRPGSAWERRLRAGVGRGLGGLSGAGSPRRREGRGLGRVGGLCGRRAPGGSAVGVFGWRRAGNWPRSPKLYKSRVHLKLGWIACLSLVGGLGKKTRRALAVVLPPPPLELTLLALLLQYKRDFQHFFIYLSLFFSKM